MSFELIKGNAITGLGRQLPNLNIMVLLTIFIETFVTQRNLKQSVEIQILEDSDFKKLIDDPNFRFKGYFDYYLFMFYLFKLTDEMKWKLNKDTIKILMLDLSYCAPPFRDPIIKLYNSHFD